jgi:hypothetical protein
MPDSTAETIVDLAGRPFGAIGSGDGATVDRPWRTPGSRR